MRRFLDSEATGGIVLMGVTVVALAVANSPLAGFYFGALNAYVLGLTVLHWINDGLMAVFFLLVGLEIKREMLDGQLSTWPRRALPGIAALGGMVVPALVYLAITRGDPEHRARMGDPDRHRHRVRSRRPRHSRNARADLSEDLSDRARDPRRSRGDPDHRAVLCRRSLVADARRRFRVRGGSDRAQPLRRHAARALSGGRRGVVGTRPEIRNSRHPRGRRAGADDPASAGRRRRRGDENSPLHRLEHALHAWVAFAVIPIFGFANAGRFVCGLVALAIFWRPCRSESRSGLFAGKQIGVFGVHAGGVPAGSRRCAGRARPGCNATAWRCCAASASP